MLFGHFDFGQFVILGHFVILGISTYNHVCFITVVLLEYDKRFSGFGEDFIFYDYKNPLGIPRHLASGFDLVFADPPFLSDECLTKTAVTVKFMAKEKIILCTGKFLVICFHEKKNV